MNTRDKMLKKASKMIPEENIIRSYIEPYEGPVESIENPDKAFGYWLNESHEWTERKKLNV
jgi:hypothetical protein